MAKLRLVVSSQLVKQENDLRIYAIKRNIDKTSKI